LIVTISSEPILARRSKLDRLRDWPEHLRVDDGGTTFENRFRSPRARPDYIRYYCEIARLWFFCCGFVQFCTHQKTCPPPVDAPLGQTSHPLPILGGSDAAIALLLQPTRLWSATAERGSLGILTGHWLVDQARNVGRLEVASLSIGVQGVEHVRQTGSGSAAIPCLGMLCNAFWERTTGEHIRWRKRLPGETEPDRGARLKVPRGERPAGMHGSQIPDEVTRVGERMIMAVDDAMLLRAR
jgi:hypothetical protein